MSNTPHVNEYVPCINESLQQTLFGLIGTVTSQVWIGRVTHTDD